MEHVKPDRMAFGLDDAADAIGVSRRSLYGYMTNGRLKTVKIGGRRLILRKDLEAFLEAAREAA